MATGVVTDDKTNGVSPWIYKATKEWGIFAVMCAFFVWWSYAREGALNKRIDNQDEFIRTKLVTLVENNTKAFEQLRSDLKK